ncbi:MAG: hypothetical protein KDC54_03395 [Lewinella sp.]|nr:hypothetical protein [Lewinella sp.]
MRILLLLVAVFLIHSLRSQDMPDLPETVFQLNWDTLYQELGIPRATLLEEERYYDDLIYQRWEQGDSTVQIHNVYLDQYLVVIRKGEDVRTRGLYRPTEGILIDSITAYDPTTFLPTVYHIFASNLEKTGEWLETDPRGQARTGSYHYGQRHGWWTFAEQEGSYTALFDLDSLVGYGEVAGLPQPMLMDLLRGRWYLVNHSLNGRIDQHGAYRQHGETWTLQRALTDFWFAAIELDEGFCQIEEGPLDSPYHSGLYPWTIESDHSLSFEFETGRRQRASIKYISRDKLTLEVEYQ